MQQIPILKPLHIPAPPPPIHTHARTRTSLEIHPLFCMASTVPLPLSLSSQHPTPCLPSYGLLWPCLNHSGIQDTVTHSLS